MREIECVAKEQCREIFIGVQVPIEWALPLYGYVMPCIVAVTIATNSFIVLVLSRRNLRTPTNVVLLAMAVTELLTGLSSLPWLLYYYTFKGYKTEQTLGLPAFWCNMFPYMASILPSIFHTAAIWLTVYLAVQRYIYICVPKIVRKQCTMRRSKQVIVTICIASVWIYSPDLLANYNKSHEKFFPQFNVSRQACFRYRSSFINFVGSNFYYYTVFGVHTLLSHTLPCILLVCFTWKLISAIRIADQRYAHLIASRNQNKYATIAGAKSSIDFSMDVSQFDSDSLKGAAVATAAAAKRRTSTFESKRVQSLKQNTRMLIAVILLFLVTEIPAALIFSLHVSMVAFSITYMQRHYVILNKLLIVRNVLIIVTYPMRFAIYCGMSQQFRECVRQMLIRGRNATVAADDIQYEHIVAHHNSRGDVNFCQGGGGSAGGIPTMTILERTPFLAAQKSSRSRSHSSVEVIAAGSVTKPTTNSCAKCSPRRFGLAKLIERAATTEITLDSQRNGNVCSGGPRVVANQQQVDSGCSIDSDDLSNNSRNDETV